MDGSKCLLLPLANAFVDFLRNDIVADSGDNDADADNYNDADDIQVVVAMLEYKLSLFGEQPLL